MNQYITFNILLIENNSKEIKLIKSLLENIFLKEYSMLSLKITVVKDEDQVISSALCEKPDIIISNFGSSVINDINTIDKIHHLNANVPFLIILEQEKEKYIDELFLAGITNYSFKPLKEKFFIAQIKLFVDLYLRRQNIYNYKALNLFSKNIYRRKTEFLIEEENDIFEFWEFILENLFNKCKVEKVLHFIYDIELYMIKNGYFNTIVLEEDNENFYLTLPEMDKVPPEVISSMILRKSIDISKYKRNGCLISLIISKNENDKKISITSDTKKAIFKDIRRLVQEDISTEEFLKQLKNNYNNEIESIFTLLKKISILIYQLEEALLEKAISIIQEITFHFELLNQTTHKIGLSNTLYRSFNNLVAFLKNIDVNILQTTKKRVLLSQMLQGLVYDLKSWARILFIDESTQNINYFDASFAENCFAIEATFNEIEIDDESDLEFFDEPTQEIKTHTVNEDRMKDLRFSQTDKMSAKELLNVLDYEIIDKVESLVDELNSLIEIIYIFDEETPETALSMIPSMQNVIQDIYIIVDSIGFFHVTARAFENLNVFLSKLSLENISDTNSKKLFVQMFLSLIQDLEKWIEVIFIETKTDDIHYFDASFSSNIFEIESVFEQHESSEDDLEFF